MQKKIKDDTISRQAAIEVVKHAWAKGLEPTQYLEELPAVQTCEDAVSRQQAIDAVLRAEALVRAYGYRYAADAVRELPAVQPQPEIIRCKDCKYWREHKYAKETKRYIPFCGFNAINTKADDYCSYAERRTDD